MKKNSITLITALIFLVSCSNVGQVDSFVNQPVATHADLVMVAGTASYNPTESLGVAQHLALADAERKAAQQSLLLEANTAVTQDGVHTTTQIYPRNNIGQTQIITQQQNSDSISLLAQIEKIPHGTCVKNVYKKKIAVTTFPVVHSEHIADIPRANYEFAEILARKLYETQGFIVRDVEEVNIFDHYPFDPYLMAPRTDELQDNPGVVKLAEKIDAQFIISGVIHDLNFRKSELSIVDRLNFLSFLDIFPHERTFGVEIFIYDGLTGAMIYRNEYKNKAQGKVYFPYLAHMDSDEFLHSDIGKIVSGIIMNQVRDIDTKLNCFPMMEKVLRVDGDTVYFNAGSLQNIHVGDMLLLYSAADKYTRGVYYQNTRLRGYLEKPKSVLTVQQVQPLFAVGVLDIKNKDEVYPLDIVRAW